MRGRAWARHQRERIIKHRQPFAWWVRVPGKLAYHGMACRCTCPMCVGGRHAHMRYKWRREAQREIRSALVEHEGCDESADLERMFDRTWHNLPPDLFKEAKEFMRSIGAFESLDSPGFDFSRMDALAAC